MGIVIVPSSCDCWREKPRPFETVCETPTLGTVPDTWYVWGDRGSWNGPRVSQGPCSSRTQGGLPPPAPTPRSGIIHPFIPPTSLASLCAGPGAGNEGTRGGDDAITPLPSDHPCLWSPAPVTTLTLCPVKVLLWVPPHTSVEHTSHNFIVLSLPVSLHTALSKSHLVPLTSLRLHPSSTPPALFCSKTTLWKVQWQEILSSASVTVSLGQCRTARWGWRKRPVARCPLQFPRIARLTACCHPSSSGSPSC